MRCPCGTASTVQAGETATCACGNTWDTARLPRADLRGLDAVVRRHRRNELVFVLTMVLVIGALALVARSAPLPLTAAVFALAWLRFCRPWWRRRRGGRLAGLPEWELESSSPPAP